jgi:hypothetical protein
LIWENSVARALDGNVCSDEIIKGCRSVNKSISSVIKSVLIAPVELEAVANDECLIKMISRWQQESPVVRHGAKTMNHSNPQTTV